MKPIEIMVTKYQAHDGRVFDTESEANHYEKLLSGERKKCPDCHGEGTVDLYGDDRCIRSCGTCDGHGWVSKKEIWTNSKKGTK